MEYKTPEELFSFLKNNFKYDNNHDITYSIEEFKNNLSGHCFDITWYERSEFKNMGIPCEIYFIWGSKNGNYLKNFNSHMFLVYKHNNKYCWFEVSWYNQQGIHRYNNFDDLKNDLSKKAASHDADEIVWWRAKYEPGKDTWEIIKNYFSKQPLYKIKVNGGKDGNK